MKGYVQSGNQVYQRWIDDNVCDNPIGQCRRMAEAMCKQFPELSVKGYFDMFGYGHTWCVEPSGKIVDPTSHQFHTPYNYPSDPFNPEDFSRGKCMWCGEIILPNTKKVRKYFKGMHIGPHKRCDKYLIKLLG